MLYVSLVSFSVFFLDLRISCTSDSVNARTLEKFMGSDGSTTVANCLATCEAQGYTIAGVEYGRECCKFLSGRVTICGLNFDFSLR